MWKNGLTHLTTMKIMKDFNSLRLKKIQQKKCKDEFKVYARKNRRKDCERICWS